MEIQRILNVIDESIADVEILEYLPCLSTPPSTDFVANLPIDVQKAIAALHGAEKDYEKVLQSFSKHADTLEAINALKYSTRSACYQVNKHACIDLLRQKVPKSSAPRTKIATKLHFADDSPFVNKQAESLLHSDNLDRFRTVLVQLRAVWDDKLHTTTEEEQMRIDQKNETAARDKKASADLKALQRELAAERSIREREVSLREDALNKLKEELNALKGASMAETKEFESKLMEKETKSQNDFVNLKAYMEAEIKKRKDELDVIKESQAVLEKELRAKRIQSEKKVEDWLNKYDTFMTKTTNETELLKSEYNTDEVRVQFLKAELARFAEERRQREEVERQREEERKQRESIQKQKIRAAGMLLKLYFKFKAKKLAKEKEAAAAKKKSPKKKKSASPKK